MTTPEPPAPQSAGLSEREKCPLCEHEWRRHDPEDGLCDADPPCACGRDLLWMRDRIAALSRCALADEKGEARALLDDKIRLHTHNEDSHYCWRENLLTGVITVDEGPLGQLIELVRKSERDALKEKLAAAERVVEAARVVSSAFFYIPREADAALRDALKGYDALSRS